MGADLICSVLEIDKDKEPDFEAAVDFVKKLDVAQLWKAKYEVDQCEMDDFPSADEMEATLRQEALAAVEYAAEGWAGAYRNVTKLYLKRSYVLFVGEMSWGDTPEGVNELQLFDVLGAAQAAGFEGCNAPDLEASKKELAELEAAEKAEEDE